MSKSIIILFLIFPIVTFGQVKNIGTPYIQNYPKSVYQAGTQNWGIAQDENGFMYFANNDGVLIFDGLHWDLVKVSESSGVRSICVDKNNSIYVGFYNDFGILKANESGVLSFHSLRDLIPFEINDIDEVWKIYDTSFGIVFQSFDYLFILNDNKIQVIQPKQKFHFSFVVNNRLFLHEPGIGLFEFINGLIHKVPWAEKLHNVEIWAILPLFDNHLLIGTARDGIYKLENGRLEKWNTPVGKLVEKNKLFSAVKIKGNNFAFGTILDGLVISDQDGNVILHVNRNIGLHNNTVLSLYSDNDENLWLGLDNGIDYIEINSPITFISDFDGIGTGYCCQIFDGKLYLGTNQGLYVKSFNNFSRNSNKFELVNNTAGQVWSLNIFDGQLICGHNLGTFRINNREAIKISDEEGAWRFISLKNHSDLLLGGNYGGLSLLKKGAEGWNFYKNIKGFSESSRFLRQDVDGAIWISHGAKGIFRVELNENMDSVVYSRLYTENEGLPSNDRNILFELNDEGYISTIEGIYEYDADGDTFIVSGKVNKLLAIDSRLKTIETDKSGNIWYIAENESGVLRSNEDLTHTKIVSPFKQLEGKYVNEFEFLYPFDNDHVFLGIDNGFAHYSSKFPKFYMQLFNTYITKVELPYLDSIVPFSLLKSENEFSFPFKRNSMRFHFSAPFFENQKPLEFSYFIDNYSEKWSDWSQNSYKDFTNFSEGEYTFKVKAKNVYGIESEISEFNFVITPPWFRSSQAYYFYLFVIGLIVFVSVKVILHRLELSKGKERIKHEHELLEKEEHFEHQKIIAEKQIIKLRNEKLRADMLHRDKELANQTMSIIQKNKFLMKLNNELQRMQSSTDDATVKTKILVIKKRIDKEIDNKQQNKIFETYFDEVHIDFFNRLKVKYPQLSPKEVRLCAFIRMNISTKEIATLLNITDRGVEISRYRLRKKLELSRDTNLPTFLSNI